MKTEIRSFEVDEITKLLDAGGNFRKLQEANGRRWLGEMAAGRWVQPHPSPIVLTRNGGAVIDGQHRLWAAREHQKATRRKIKFLVVYIDGNEESVSLSVDTNKKRTIADYLRHMQVENVNTVACCLQIAANACEGDKLRATTFDSTGGLSPTRMAALFEAEKPRIMEASHLAVTCSKTTIGSPGLMAGVAYLIGKKNRAGCRTFFERLAAQTGLEDGDPILRLIKYFQEQKNRGSRRAVVRRAIHAAVVIKAWNAWANGEKVKILRWTINGENPEEFPQIERGDLNLFGSVG